MERAGIRTGGGLAVKTSSGMGSRIFKLHNNMEFNKNATDSTYFTD